MIPPPRWTSDHLEQRRKEAVANFRRVRLEEPLEAYLEFFDRYQGMFEELLELTVDLSQIGAHGLHILTQDKLIEAVRYLAGPPISTDDLKTLSEAETLNESALRKNPDLVNRVVDLILIALDRRRFPWVTQHRDPTESERLAAVIGSTALLATAKIGTSRRTQGKKDQEQLVEDALLTVNFRKVPSRKIETLSRAPGPGEFCGESIVGTRKADFVVRLWDDRVMALECKVSNSALNSVKRLNNDAAAKAEAWRKDFGETQIVPAAVISGVYKLKKLEEAQRRGLTLFWSHNLAELLDWIEGTRQ
jgi:hypothetical protein